MFHQVDFQLNLSSNLNMSINVKIAVASENDAGNYTCQPDLITPANITLVSLTEISGSHQLSTHEGWRANCTLVLTLIV